MRTNGESARENCIKLFTLMASQGVSVIRSELLLWRYVDLADCDGL